MTMEKPPQNVEAEIIWAAKAERFIGKVNDEAAKIESIPGVEINKNERWQKLESLKATITELFSVYEAKNFTLEQVEADLEYRIDNEEDENRIKEYKQIKLFVNARFAISV